jgi:hypothetical protein
MTKMSKVLFTNCKAINDFHSLLTIVSNSVSIKDISFFNCIYPSAQTGPSSWASMMSPAIRKESTSPPLLENRSLSISLSDTLWNLGPSKKEFGCFWPLTFTHFVTPSKIPSFVLLITSLFAALAKLEDFSL